jgi:hypothetical protein
MDQIDDHRLETAISRDLLLFAEERRQIEIFTVDHIWIFTFEAPAWGFLE